MEMEKVIGYCGVDSGQILLIDPCYVWKDQFNVGGEPTGGNYDTACRITLSDGGAGEVAGGVVSGTAWGDGSYPVTAVYSGDRIVRLTIDFDPQDEDEDDVCWDCGEPSDWCDGFCQDEEE